MVVTRVHVMWILPMIQLKDGSEGARSLLPSGWEKGRCVGWCRSCLS